MSRDPAEKTENSVYELSRGVEGININPPTVSSSTSSLSPYSQNALQKLQLLQKEHRKIEEEFEQQWLELKSKFEDRYKPLYQARAAILSTPDESDNSFTSIPKFWLTVFWNNSTLRAMIEDEDTHILEYLLDVKSEWMDQKKQESFILHFVFAPNPYFTNTVLSKKYNMNTAPDEDDPIFSSTESTKINWKENKDVTKKLSITKKKNKRTSEIKIFKEHVENKYSFFSFFSNIEIPSAEKLQTMHRNEVESLRYDLEFEYGAGVTFRDRIIPYAAKWYLGEMESDESDDDWSISETNSENDQDDNSIDSFIE